jgi:hypothetical protein
MPRELAAVIGAAMMIGGVAVVGDRGGTASAIAEWNRRVWAAGLSSMRGPTSTTAVRVSGAVAVVVGAMWLAYGLLLIK